MAELHSGPLPPSFAHYRLLERLARSPAAEVFKAKSYGVEGFEKVLVVKRLAADLGTLTKFAERFVREAKIAVTLSHANIVQVIDVDQVEGSYFIAMEYVPGLDLGTLLDMACRHGKPLPPQLAAFVVSEVAKGLDYAHRRRDAGLRSLNVVHGGIRPRNVLLSFEGEVKLSDFGIAPARAVVEPELEPAMVAEHHAYAAPEQMRTDAVDPRADLYALGVLLYEAVSGSNPLRGRAPAEIAGRLEQHGRLPFDERASRLPEPLAEVIRRATSVDPARRHEHAGELYDELVQFIYTSGQRGDVYALSAYLDELRTSDAPPNEAELDSAEVSLQAAFEAGSSVIPPELIPDPASSSSPGPLLDIPAPPAAPLPSHIPPYAECRELSLLVFRAPRTAAPAEPDFRDALQRFRGTTVQESTWTEGDQEIVEHVVLFGIQEHDGRDTEEAIRCARRWWPGGPEGAPTRESPAPAVAIHVGPVLVDASDRAIPDSRYDGLLHAAKTAAGKAGGRIVLTAGARRAAPRDFEFREVDGVHELVGERARSDRARRFVGRHSQLRHLGTVLAQASRGVPVVLGLVGEAGIGKSRLVAEAERRLRNGGHDVGFYVARLPRGKRTVARSALQEMLRAILGIDELDSAPVAREKVGRLRELGLSRPATATVEHTLGLARAEEEPPGDRALRAALGRIALKLAEDRLTVFVFDGVEAMDADSMSLLDPLLRNPRGGAFAVVLAYRPEGRHPWRDAATYREIELGPLSDDEVRRLTARRLGVRAVPAALGQELADKSAGNPLFMEEYLRALLDAEAVDVVDGEAVYRPDVAVEVPKTLRGIVGNRLRGLDAFQRYLLQIASLAGSRFPPALLAEVSGEGETLVQHALDDLAQQNVVTREGRECTLAHEPVRDALRASLPIDTQREMHATLAAALQRLYPDHLDDLAELLAHHHREAGHPLEAVDALERAARRLESENALAAAVSSMLDAIELMKQLPNPDYTRLFQLYAQVGELSVRAHEMEQGVEHMAAAVELAESLGRTADLAYFSMMRGRLLAQANRIEQGRPWLDRARQLAESLEGEDLLRNVIISTAEAHTRNGEWTKAIAAFREALELREGDPGVRTRLRCLSPLAQCYAGVGDRRRALATLDEARQLLDEHRDRHLECELLKNDSIVHHLLGDWERAVDSARRALELAKEHGLFHEAAVNAHNIGDSYLRLGNYKRAFANLRYSYEVAVEHGLLKLQYLNMCVLGFIDAVRSGSPQGRTRVEAACRYAEEHGYVWDLIQAKYMLALVDASLGSPEAARQALREVLRLCAEHGNRHYEADAQRALDALDSGSPVPLPG